MKTKIWSSITFVGFNAKIPIPDDPQCISVLVFKKVCFCVRVVNTPLIKGQTCCPLVDKKGGLQKSWGLVFNKSVPHMSSINLVFSNLLMHWRKILIPNELKCIPVLVFKNCVFSCVHVVWSLI